MSKASAQGGRPKARYRTRNWREDEAGPTAGLLGRGDPMRADAEGVVPAATAGGAGDGGQPYSPGRAGLEGAALQHPLTTAEGPGGPDPPPPAWRAAAPRHLQHP